MGGEAGRLSEVAEVGLLGGRVATRPSRIAVFFRMDDDESRNL